MTTISRRHFLRLGAATAAFAGFARGADAPAGPHSLAPLPYAPDALEPHIDATTMGIHHGKHHAAYVAKLNEALQKQSALAAKPIDALMPEIAGVEDAALRTALRNNGGGHWNHTMFWNIMGPAAKSGQPSARLLAKINGAFGSLDAFKKAFAEAAVKRFGSGWAWLIVRDGDLRIVSTPNQDNPLMKGLVPDEDRGTPLLCLDVWEHAYYLHYQNRRADYISAWWNVVNWEAVDRRLG